MYNSYGQNNNNSRENTTDGNDYRNGYYPPQNNNQYSGRQVYYSYGSNGQWNNGYGPEFYFRKQKEKKDLRKLSLLAGGAFLCYILIQNVAVLVLEAFGIMDIYRNNQIASTAMDSLFSVVSILVPFLLFGSSMKKVSGNENCYDFSKPLSVADSVLAVVAGVGICMLANVVTSFFTVFMGAFGMKLTSPDISMPTGVIGVVANIVRTVIVAAFVEEICLRGTVMGNLRQYGDKFAIGASAMVFGIMHGNLIQAPFALIAGCAMGYLSIKCGSLWIAVIIHAINNGLSVMISYLIDIVPENTALIMQMLIIYGLAAVGVICLVAFNKRNADRHLRENGTLLSSGEMTVSYITTPTMIISLLFMLYITSNYVEFGG